jgi:hypothetical protein
MDNKCNTMIANDNSNISDEVNEKGIEVALKNKFRYSSHHLKSICEVNEECINELDDIHLEVVEEKFNKIISEKSWWCCRMC